MMVRTTASREDSYVTRNYQRNRYDVIGIVNASKVTCSYDASGDILNKKEYPYTTGTLGQDGVKEND